MSKNQIDGPPELGRSGTSTAGRKKSRPGRPVWAFRVLRDSCLTAVHGGSGETTTTGICPAISGATQYSPCFECSRLDSYVSFKPSSQLTVRKTLFPTKSKEKILPSPAPPSGTGSVVWVGSDSGSWAAAFARPLVGPPSTLPVLSAPGWTLMSLLKLAHSSRAL